MPVRLALKCLALAAAATAPLLLGTAPALAYDNDDQALRVRDMLADPSVPLAWDRRHKRVTFSIYLDDERPPRRCGKRCLISAL